MITHPDAADMTVAAILNRMERTPWGYVRIDCSSEAPIKWRCRLSAWPFIVGRGAGHTMEQAVSRAYHQLCYRDALVPRLTDEDMLTAFGSPDEGG